MSLTPTNPTTLLKEAASLLRDRATAAIHEGRTTWSTGHTLGSRSLVVVDDQEQPSVLIETYAARLERVNSYLALVGPATALALADWLDQAAKHHDATVIGAASVWRRDHEADERDAWVAKQTDHAALAVARQVLGTPATEFDKAADEQEPVQLRWGLDDVMYGDDDTTTVLLSGPGSEPYWLELDPERTAAMRNALAGPEALPAPGPLTPAERQFLTFALDQAADEMSLGDGFTQEDEAALLKFRALAAPAETEEPTR